MNFLTPVITDGNAPPPPDSIPGWGSPWGGNSGNGGGDIANRVVAVKDVVMTGLSKKDGTNGWRNLFNDIAMFSVDSSNVDSKKSNLHYLSWRFKI